MSLSLGSTLCLSVWLSLCLFLSLFDCRLCLSVYQFLSVCWCLLLDCLLCLCISFCLSMSLTRLYSLSVFVSVLSMSLPRLDSVFVSVYVCMSMSLIRLYSLSVYQFLSVCVSDSSVCLCLWLDCILCLSVYHFLSMSLTRLSVYVSD